MVYLLSSLIPNIPFSGDIPTDVATLLIYHGCTRTFIHSSRVAAEARRLAQRWGEDADNAETAGWLHDISAIVPPEQRINLAEYFQIDILPDERRYPMILHQKLSAVMARHVFEITDSQILGAVECHSTLKADATPMDKVVFVADKIKWDQEGNPPYLDSLEAASERSLDAAALCYLEYLWDHQSSLPVLHPWMVAAYRQLGGATE